MTLTHTAQIVRPRPEVPRDKPALVHDGVVTTFGELDAGSSQVAQGLLAAGVQFGDRIAFVAPASDEYFHVLFGASKIGAITVPINPAFTSDELGYVLTDCEPAVVVSTTQVRDRVAAAGLRFDSVVLWLLSDGVAGGANTLAAWRSRKPSDDVDVAIPADSDATIQYTSGSSGRPKGVVCTHRNMMARAPDPIRSQPFERWTSDDVALLDLPICHISGTMWGVNALAQGASVVVCARFDPAQVLEAIRMWRVSKLVVVPTTLRMIMSQPGVADVDFSSVNYMLYGSAPMDPASFSLASTTFGCAVVHGYGLTESGTVTRMPPDDATVEGDRWRSVGLPSPGLEVRIADPHGNDVPPRQVGEILVRGAANMDRYWRRPDDTAATIDESGWLRTGDAGYLDEGGYLFLHDRIKDIIISGGENVSSAEVERVLVEHPAVAEVAVIGLPHPEWGEQVHALVVRAGDVAGDELIEFARLKLTKYKVPKSVEFVDQFPRTATGKILKSELRRSHASGAEPTTSSR